MRRSLGLLLGLLLGVLALGPATGASPRRAAGGIPVALVTAESENELLAVGLPSGKVLRRVHLVDPEAVAAEPTGQAVVVSPRGTVTLLDPRTLKVLAVLRAFRSPQIAAIAPGGRWAYVTDAVTGDVSVIDLTARRVVDRVYVGVGAHHVAISPDLRRAWVALGETATTIVVLDTSSPSRPRVVDSIHPRPAAHDLAFAPDGRTVWVGSASAPYVSVHDANTGRLLATVPAGPGPQHVAFGLSERPRAFVTSGYGSTVEMVDVATREVLRRAAVPYGSFNVAASGGIVVTASLLDGAVTELTDGLKRLMQTTAAARARDAAISVW